MTGGDDILGRIKANQENEHDTLYCNPLHKQQLLDDILFNSRAIDVDDLRLSGLKIFSHARFENPIVCEKGDVFNLAEDYKNGEAEPEEM